MLKMQQVARNTRSCQKIAEQLVESPRQGLWASDMDMSTVLSPSTQSPIIMAPADSFHPTWPLQYLDIVQAQKKKILASSKPCNREKFRP